MFKRITLLILIVLVFFIGYRWYEKNQWVGVSQDIADTGYRITISYPQNSYWIVKHGKRIDNENGEKAGWIILKDKEKPQEKYIDFRYTLENNGDDTPHIAGDTGAGMWPPQPEELMVDFDKDKYRYLGTYLGKELYVEKNPEMSMGVFQKLKNGKLTARMPLLSKDQERVNYYDYFSIIANARGSEFTEKDYKELHDEFLKILKTMKIEKIFDNTKTTE